MLLVLALGGCTSGSGLFAGGTAITASQGTTTTAPAAPDSVPAPATVATTPTAGATTGPCNYRQDSGYVLPDPGCTPGVTNPSVSQANIDQTICVRGWTSTVRPEESYTETLKRQQMDRYGQTGSMSGYEEDHLVPLELGGSPADPRNLWPEPGASPTPKDDVEYAANRAVCSGGMPLAQAQQEIATDWVTFGESLGVLKGGG